MRRGSKPSKQRGAGKTSSAEMGQVRIIGGDWRGRKLPVVQQEGLRPTSDRVRETLFNWLQFEIAGARCLDVFAGSGALGMEALSRGAKQVTFLELAASVAAQLKKNLTLLSADNALVLKTDSLQWLAQPASTELNVIFLDPPFHQGLMEEALALLVANGYLQTETHDGAKWIYLEQEKSQPWPTLPNGWRCHREKETSQVRFGLFEFHPEATE